MKSVRLMLAAGLAAAAALKAWDLLSGGARAGTLLPPVVAAAVAAVEVGVAGLLVGCRWRVGAWCALGLGWGFLAAVVVMKATGIDAASCGCLGRLEVNRWQHAGIAAGIALAAAGLVVADGGSGAAKP